MRQSTTSQEELGVKVLFLNPPFLPRYSRSQRSPGVIRSGTLYYPIWLSYAVGVAEEVGAKCRLLDCPADELSEEDVFNVVRTWEPDIIITDTSTPSAETDLSHADRLQKEFPDKWVVAVGTHISATWQESFELYPNLRAAALREYDFTVRDLILRRAEGKTMDGCPGMALREGGKAQATPARAPIEDIDSLPFVSQVYARHLYIPNYRYSITRHPVITIITGRGCPFHCVYCVYPQVMHGHTYRCRSAESVKEEFKYIRTDLPNVREIFIEDDTFTVDKPRLREVCEALIRDGNTLRFTANSRSDLSEEDLRLLHRAGCRLLCVGFESEADHMLKSMKKAMVSTRARQFRENAQHAGVMIHGCFMVGNPGETLDTMRGTLEYAKELACDSAQFFPIMVYPGTEAYEWAKEQGYLKAETYREWVDETGQHRSVVETDHVSADELMAFCDAARREYYLRPQYIWQQLCTIARTPGEAPRILSAFGKLSRFLFRKPAAL